MDCKKDTGGHDDKDPIKTDNSGKRNDASGAG